MPGCDESDWTAYDEILFKSWEEKNKESLEELRIKKLLEKEELERKNNPFSFSDNPSH